MEGCEIKFPDSAFFREDGKPMFIARTDKDGKMISDFKQSSLQLNSIRQKFFEIVRDRKNESKTVQDEYFKRQENAN